MATEFDLTGPLPEGLLVIEASAGTGKTYTLTGLALRSIAEDDIAVSSLCLVTFTEAATAEMRGRLRTALTQAVAHLTSDDVHHSDTLMDALGSDLARRGVYAARLERALADLDTAWITTIHGWCARVLGSAGVWHSPTSTLVHDDDVAEALHDLIVARYGVSGDLPATIGNITKAVRARLSMPLARLQGIEPADLSAASAAQQRKQAVGLDAVARADEVVAFIEEIVAEVLRRRRRRGRQSFDDLLVDTRQLLMDPRRTDVVETLRQRFAVVLIDEFQDTDQIQWDLFRRAFLEPLATTGGAPIRRVVLVGDPKQSIYRFRAAELSAYLAARHDAGDRIRTLQVNRRSDPALLAGVQHVLGEVTFGDEAVRFEPVRAPEGTPWNRLHGLDGPALQFRLISDVPTDAGSLRRAVRSDVAAAVQGLLSAGYRLDDGGTQGQFRDLRPGDIAVLTRSNSDASATALDLSALGIPAATASASSVLDSAAGMQWRVLLTALTRPGHLPTARAAATGWFIGAALHDIGDDRLVTADGLDVVEELHAWARSLEQGGFSRLMLALDSSGWHGRLLARVDGERHLTDVDHLAELLQTITGGRAISAAGALEALDELQASADQRVTASLLARRIDRDDDAVQVVTIHKAKGLEFPVVLCPYLWTNTAKLQGLAHAAVDGFRQIDLLSMFKVTEATRAMLVSNDVVPADVQERLAEERRLLYVALSRAKHHCLVWWAEPNSGKSEFRSLINQRGGPVTLAAASDNTIEAVAATPVTPEPLQVAAPPPPMVLPPAVATRLHDRRWRVWSFSAIKARADDAADARIGGGADEFDPSAEPASDEPVEVGSLSTLLRDAPGGTRFGTTVHSIFEHCDFAHPDLLHELTDRARLELAHRGLAITPEQLAQGLCDVVAAPLGGPGDLPALRVLERHDRLDELDFHLPLACTSTRELAARFVEHLDPHDPARPWAQGVADGSLPADVDGRLTGSIDLVARHGPDQRVWIADYKTNRLGPTNGADPRELIEAMDHSHYWFQAALYLVATHRYLRWRRSDYDPDRHLIGAAYLFVRAMTPEVPGAGIVWWRPTTAAVEALDQALAQGVSR